MEKEIRDFVGCGGSLSWSTMSRIGFVSLIEDFDAFIGFHSDELL